MKESQFEILNERPEGMSFKVYRNKLRVQSKRIRSYMRGVIVWNVTKKGSFVGFTSDLKID